MLGPMGTLWTLRNDSKLNAELRAKKLAHGTLRVKSVEPVQISETPLPPVASIRDLCISRD